MKSFGEFFDSVQRWAASEHNVDAQIYLEEWIGLVTPEKWQEARGLELADDLFTNFAEDMHSYVVERLQGICGDELYTMTMQSGHEFLKKIASIGKEYGIEMSEDQIDIPFTLSDHLVRQLSV